jgi:uncharacterized protein DUF6677
MPERNRQPRVFPLVALVLAWLIPGAGHLYIGRKVRGIIIFVTIAATFWSGVAMGGVMTVDKDYERWWYMADMLSGVHGLIAWRRSAGVYRELDRELLSDPDTQYARQLASLRRTYKNTRSLAPAAHALRQQYVGKLLAEKDGGLALVPPGESIARAYAGVAGLLNLMCIFDAVILAVMGAYGEPKREATAQVRKAEKT